MHRCLPKFSTPRRIPRAASHLRHRPLHVSLPSSSTTTLPSLENLVDVSSEDPADILRSRKLSELIDSLKRVGNASRVWAYYVGVVNILRNENLPLRIHQEVLRRCTPPTQEVRLAASRRLLAGNRPLNPHIHEGRFRAIIRNIRSMGETPSLDDYHFILEQFAAAGHYQGAMQIYNEILVVGLQPRTKTFGLCLRALAHRLTQPVSRYKQEALFAHIGDLHKELLAEMQRWNVGFHSVNFDMSIRLLKGSMDKEGCERLLKMGYGIDLANPDRPVLEYLHDANAVADPLFTKLPQPQRFSTAGLNTVIDLLGRLGDVSKLVQAFEVLTQPLPSKATQHFSSTFDEEDDDYSSSISPPTPQHVALPSASPNTTTYNTLLRYLAQANNHILARHYILQAMEYDRTSDRALRGQLAYGFPPEEVSALHFAINRGTLLPAFGAANRDKNVSMMRWIQSKLPAILRRKRNDLKMYSEYLKELDAKREETSEAVAQGSLASMSTPTPPPPSAFFSPSSSKSSAQVSVHDLDLDAPPVVAPPPVKRFNIHQHLYILQRDIGEIEQFSLDVAETLGRITQRVKERLGRRVWSQKDVYFRSTDKRQRIGRQQWAQQVNFMPQWKKRQLPQIPRALPPHLDRRNPRGSARFQSTFTRPGPRSSSWWLSWRQGFWDTPHT